jgi:hypothetical protein
MKPFNQSVKEFCEELERCLGTDALNKGYSTASEQGGRELFDDTHKYAPGHASGEIMYKIIRFDKLHTEKDMIKIAAWAFLKWDAEMRKKAASQITVTPVELQKAKLQ